MNCLAHYYSINVASFLPSLFYLICILAHFPSMMFSNMGYCRDVRSLKHVGLLCSQESASAIFQVVVACVCLFVWLIGGLFWWWGRVVHCKCCLFKKLPQVKIAFFIFHYLSFFLGGGCVHCKCCLFKKLPQVKMAFFIFHYLSFFGGCPLQMLLI